MNKGKQILNNIRVCTISTFTRLLKLDLFYFNLPRDIYIYTSLIDLREKTCFFHLVYMEDLFFVLFFSHYINLCLLCYNISLFFSYIS